MNGIRSWRSQRDGVRLHRLTVEGSNRRMIVNDEELAEIARYAQKALGGTYEQDTTPR